ncbi:mevalonate kinase [Teredinibacter turnerae]|uniref:mevalonate kinase n=1 Tax=Teredinibacter turnerae TaxID=2426 RepID=UPI0003F65E7B|nr:mevalonate kinase [Teredinibacter turnerae]
MSDNNKALTRWHSACGKVILFGEHAVVYGVPAIAGGIQHAMRARLVPSAPKEIRVSIPKWSVDVCQGEHRPGTELFEAYLAFLLDKFQLSSRGFCLELEPTITHASGLGASAAVAVASIRALADYAERPLSDEDINTLAFGCEKIAHGSPSGLDNTLATFGGIQLYQRTGEQAQCSALQLTKPLRLVVALSGKQGFTAATVERVAMARAAQPQKYDAIFESIGNITARAGNALRHGELTEVAELMTENQMHLRALGVSCDEIEHVISLAMSQGALGAKLTGSGDGGAVIIAPGTSEEKVLATLRNAGVQCFTITLGDEP